MSLITIKTGYLWTSRSPTRVWLHATSHVVFGHCLTVSVDGHQSPILPHHPIFHDILPTGELLGDVLVPATLTNTFEVPGAPSNATSPAEDVQESLYELLEYLDLLQLRSPRLRSTDSIDPFISRYSVPQTPGGKDLQPHNVRVLEWKGLISAQWILILLNQLMYVILLWTSTFFASIQMLL